MDKRDLDRLCHELFKSLCVPTSSLPGSDDEVGLLIDREAALEAELDTLIGRDNTRILIGLAYAVRHDRVRRESRPQGG